MKTVALLIFIAVYVLLLLLPNYRAISALAAAAVFVLLGDWCRWARSREPWTGTCC